MISSAWFLHVKTQSLYGHFLKKVFFFPPPRHVSCEKARWRAVQEPTVPGLSVYNDPRSHKPLPSQWITFSNSTHSKFMHLQLYVRTPTHTLTHHTHAGWRQPDTECCHPETQTVEKCGAKFCNCPWSVQYSGVRVRLQLPAACQGSS